MMAFLLVLLGLVAMLWILVFEPFGNKESRRKRFGLDQYRIQRIDRYEDANVISSKYYIQQLRRVPSIIPGNWKYWSNIQEYNCGYADCYWDTRYFNTLEEAEDVVEKLRVAPKFEGTKESTVKYIP